MTTICQHQAQPSQPAVSLRTIVAQAINQTIKLLKGKYRAKRQHQINRDAFSKMLELDDRLLSDIGVSRDDVLWASKLPVEQNAALKLDTIRQQTRIG